MQKYPVLTAVTPLADFQLSLIFGENEVRLYDFKPNLEHKYYKPLSNIGLFNSVSIVDGEIVWVSGQDFCPHTLYDNSIPI